MKIFWPTEQRLGELVYQSNRGTSHTMLTTERDLLAALGQGWLPKAIGFIFALVVGWLSRRPAERSALAAVVDARINKFMDRLQTRCDDLEQKLVDDRTLCDEQLSALHRQIVAGATHQDQKMATLQGQIEMRPWPQSLDAQGLIGGEGLK